MTTLTASTQTTTTNTICNDYADGKFDAALGLAPKTLEGEYFAGYLNYTTETGKAPF
ncbi:hypothetical protein [Nodularia chucula]|uniref:hypothetical protein n=1 Tax=Nodularia chucula TaxID=3093667 RepID=UPI0039C7202A